MLIDINKIVFGNPCKRDYDIIRKATYLDSLLPELVTITPPDNGSGVTLSELKMLAKRSTDPDNESNHLYDEHLLNSIKSTFIQQRANESLVNEICESIANDVVPIVTKIKYYFNRPRPTQLSAYLGVDLHPLFSFFSSSPSYPSGHVTMSAITIEVLGSIYPDAYMKARPLINNIRSSRIHMGVHYPSDNEMAMVLASKVIEHQEFKKKYDL